MKGEFGLDIMSFFAPLLTISIAELGDKTMFLVMALSSKNKIKDVVLGISLAAILLNVFAVAVGSAIGNFIPETYMKLVAGILFIGFAVWTVIESKKSKDKKKSSVSLKVKPFIVIAITFFIAEFGDKTQFTTMSIAASSPGDEIAVFLGSFIGLLLGDSIGILIGRIFGKRIPDKIFTLLSAAVFALFGIITLFDAWQLFTFR